MSKTLRNLLIGFTAFLLLVLMLMSVFGRSGVSFIEDALGGVALSVNKVSSNVSYFIDEKVEPFFNVLSYKRYNENLVRENEELKEELIKLTLTRKEIAELEELRSALHIQSPSETRDYVGANVIGKDPGNWFHYFVIDVGSADGVSKNSAVVNGEGLVGLVYEVGTNWSKVVSIIDQRSAVAFEMVKSIDDFDGMVNGTKNFELMCEFYDPDAEYEIGDYLMTSGIGIYPQGIMIGKITETIDSKDEVVGRAIVEPVVDFHKIKKVLVIKYQER